MTDSQIPAPEEASPTPETSDNTPVIAQEPVSDVPATEPVVAPPVEPSVAETTPAVAPAVAPVTVDQRTRRTDADALQGHPVVVTDGEHAGQVGVFLQPVTTDPETGYPVEILIRFKSASYSTAQTTVPYESVRPADHLGHQ